MKSVITGKCPQCRDADMFCENNPYKLKSLFLMKKYCDKCGLVFNKEPGFFFGSMYVGYGLSVGYLMTFYAVMIILVPDFEVETYFIFGIGSLLLLTPVIFKVSRSIWINMFVNYDPDAIEIWEKTGNKTDNPCIEV